MTPQETIEDVLFAAVRDIDTFAADAKAWPNVPFDPPGDGSFYLRVDHLPNVAERLFVKGSDPHLYHGILQLTVVGALNAGPSGLTSLAGQVADFFPADRAFFTLDAMKLRIERAPDLAPAFRDGHSWRAPVSIRYECLGSPSFNSLFDAIDAVHVAVVGMLGEA